MLEKIIDKDHQLLIFINQQGSVEWDNFWLTLTNVWNWLPFFLLMLFVAIKNFSKKEVQKILIYTLYTLIFTVILTNGTKEIVQRLRPLHNEELIQYLRIITKEKGYSFFSGHTSNSVAICTFIYLVFKSKLRWAFWVYLWAIPYAFSRLYLGVHFPSDILVGILVGVFTSNLVYYFYKKKG